MDMLGRREYGERKTEIKIQEGSRKRGREGAEEGEWEEEETGKESDMKETDFKFALGEKTSEVEGESTPEKRTSPLSVGPAF